MEFSDIGVDLGTSTVVIYSAEKGVLLNEPTVIAIDTRDGAVIGTGSKGENMLGRAPAYIDVVRPLVGGVISDYEMTTALLKDMLSRVGISKLLKPRVCVSVPPSITDVEADALTKALLAADARQVFLIDEPIAAAMGAGVDILQARGHLVVDIGGGATDIAVLSLGGKVQSSSVKIAGSTVDLALLNHLHDKFDLAIGEQMAEKIKLAVASCAPGGSYEQSFEAKGRDIVTGLPKRIRVSTEDVREPVMAVMDKIITAVRSVLERTPPELAGDIYTEGITLTGGGALLHGFADYMREVLQIPVHLSEHAAIAAAMGAGMSFAHEKRLEAGFRDETLRQVD